MHQSQLCVRNWAKVHIYYSVWTICSVFTATARQFHKHNLKRVCYQFPWYIKGREHLECQLILSWTCFKLCLFILLMLPSLHFEFPFHLHSSLFPHPLPIRHIYFPHPNLKNIDWGFSTASLKAARLLPAPLYLSCFTPSFVQPDELMFEPFLFGTFCDTSPNSGAPNLCSHVRSR